jgi:hypothetical protein
MGLEFGSTESILGFRRRLTVPIGHVTGDLGVRNGVGRKRKRAMVPNFTGGPQKRTERGTRESAAHADSLNTGGRLLVDRKDRSP